MNSSRKFPCGEDCVLNSENNECGFVCETNYDDVNGIV
jgi:hypothetical protein